MANSKLDLDSVVQASGDHLRAELDDATVLLHLGSGEYFSLGGVAGHVWQVLQEPITVAALIDQLLLQYAVDETRCRTETMSMLERLQAEGFLSVKCG
ncbi:MAG: PqqD family protein [Pseudomarimonas sp.]